MLPTHTHTGRGRRRGSSLRRAVNVAAVALPLAALFMLFGGSASLASHLAGRHARANGGAAAVPTVVAADAAAPRAAAASGAPPDACAALVADWVAASDARAAARAAAPRPGLTYFLHVPRTAGRTLFFCALKPAFAPSERCQRSYDHLRVDPAAPTCALLSTHDDFRLVEAFPAGGAVLITQLRDPVDRLLSAYEFAVEVAARNFGGVRAKPDGSGQRTDTQQVWPWNVLVPLMARDMDARAAAAPKPPRGNGYNASDLIMPLSEFVALPVVHDLIHNGATFQLLGLTNNTVAVDNPGADGPTAAALRACARAGGPPARALAAAAARRLSDEVDVVLLKERLHDSVALAAAALGRPLNGPSYRMLGDAREAAERDRLDAALADGEGARREAALAAAAAADLRAQSGEPLAAAFTACAAQQRDKTGERKVKGLAKLKWADGSPLMFRRDDIPPGAADAIAAANWMDVALHAQGSRLFEARRAALAKEGKLQRLKPDGTVAPLQAAGEGA
jgi:hypothetical protein